MQIGKLTVERKHIIRPWNYARKVNWLNVLRNRVSALRNPDVKIFLIGPNRCATMSFHKFFHFHGLRSLHCREGDLYLAREIRDRLGDEASMRSLLSKWTVFSDFVYLTEEEHYEAHGLYPLFHKLYPNAYFILNDRDTEAWINSRLRFKDNFLERYLSVHGGTKEAALRCWQEEQDQHRSAALKYFAGNPRFHHAKIDQRGEGQSPGNNLIRPIVQMMGSHFFLDEALWSRFNATTP